MILYIIGFLIFVLFIPFSWVWCCTSQLPFAMIAAPSQWQIKERKTTNQPPMFWGKLWCVLVSVLLSLLSYPWGRAPSPLPHPKSLILPAGPKLGRDLFPCTDSPSTTRRVREGTGWIRTLRDQEEESFISGKQDHDELHVSSCSTLHILTPWQGGGSPAAGQMCWPGLCSHTAMACPWEPAKCKGQSTQSRSLVEHNPPPKLKFQPLCYIENKELFKTNLVFRYQLCH